MPRLRAVLLTALVFSVWRPASADPKRDEILGSVFIGQAYGPSRFYLLGFHGTEASVTWPKKVTVRSMEPSVTLADRHADFEEELNADKEGDDDLENREIEAASLPKPIGFFGTVEDSQVEDRHIGEYAGMDKVMASYPIVAFAPVFDLGNLNFTVAGKKRTMTETEKAQVAARRSHYQQETKDSDCTTEPGFLDEAKQLWTAEIKNKGFWVRLSQYDDPGCGGHLSQVYVLDVMEGGEVRESRELRHYFGAI
jgi:hypothetical protein